LYEKNAPEVNRRRKFDRVESGVKRKKEGGSVKIFV